LWEVPEVTASSFQGNQTVEFLVISPPEHFELVWTNEERTVMLYKVKNNGG